MHRRILGPPSSRNRRTCELCDFLFQCLPIVCQENTSSKERIHLTFEHGAPFIFDEDGVIMRVLSYNKRRKRDFRLKTLATN